ncbi:TPA: hypothetical protein RH266_004256 [Escherichia coli]|nr:hypothetical protein [Escherichia coli]HDV3906641.1 hypothetical protein [Escherichia coli]
MKSKQGRKGIPNKDIASIALWRAKRREQCKRMAQEEISHQRAIEELDRVLLRQFKAFI